MMESPCCSSLSEDLMLFLQVKDEDLHDNDSGVNNGSDNIVDNGDDESPNVAGPSKRFTMSKFCAPSDVHHRGSKMKRSRGQDQGQGGGEDGDNGEDGDEDDANDDSSYRHVLFPITPISRVKKTKSGKSKQKQIAVEDHSGYDSDDVVIKSPIHFHPVTALPKPQQSSTVSRTLQFSSSETDDVPTASSSSNVPTPLSIYPSIIPQLSTAVTTKTPTPSAASSFSTFVPAPYVPPQTTNPIATTTLTKSSSEPLSTLELMRQKKKAEQLLKQQQASQAVDREVQEILDNARRTTEQKKALEEEKKRKRDSENELLLDESLAHGTSKRLKMGGALTTTTVSKLTQPGFGARPMPAISTTAGHTTGRTVFNPLTSPSRNTPSKIPRFNPRKAHVNKFNAVESKVKAMMNPQNANNNSSNSTTAPPPVATNGNSSGGVLTPRPFNLDDANEIHTMNLSRSSTTSMASRFGFRSNSTLSAQSRTLATNRLKSMTQVPTVNALLSKMLHDNEKKRLETIGAWW